MRTPLYSTVLFALCLLGAGQARAEHQPTLDEALAGTLHEGPPAVADRLCRTLTDMGRRSRKATVCMPQADWDLLVRASKDPKRSAVVRIGRNSAQR